jgi:alkyl sulfatase BDS1-like metallo-beta-lactamase superfamily hydrolase
VKANQKILSERPFANRSDFTDARKGFIAKIDGLELRDQNGNLLFRPDDFSFVDQDGSNAPASVNPSLWRQAALNNIHGLFEVSKGIYQIRGTDLSNMSIIEGDSGWILVDPLTARETASASFKLAQKHLGKKPVKAILFTHSHLDHFGGVDGILEHLTDDEKNNLRIIAPEGFVEEATSENIIAGIAMGRRAEFMYGKRLANDIRGHVDTGLGKLPVAGSFTFKQPTEIVTHDNLNLVIDGVPFEFQVVSGSEAPSEFTFYLPEQKAFCGAELVSRNMHNLYTLRGAKVRDARLWTAYIEEARVKFSDADVYFASHHWPLWGKDNINNFLEVQRDTYKFIHDQTVRMMNQGYTPNEIANQIKLPEALNQDFHNQGYYGTVQHNSKAVYQFYIGWYTGNPAKLHPLPESVSASHYVDMMGGISSVVEKAQKQFEEASNADAETGTERYRWLAELLNQAVFAAPDNTDARALLAKVYDQLGYQAESGPWRDVYLSAAYELRHGSPDNGIITPVSMKEILKATPVEELLASMSVRLNAEDAEGEELSILLNFTDVNEKHLITVKNSVMHHKKIAAQATADATLNLTFTIFVDIAVGQASLKDLLLGDELSVDGSSLDVLSFVGMFDKPAGTFNIVTP